MQAEPDAAMEDPPVLEGATLARVGMWFTPAFEAVTLAGVREIEADTLIEIDLGFRVRSGAWSLAVSGNHASSGDLDYAGASVLAGVNVDVEIAAGLPVELSLSAGPIYGRLDVEHPGFGDFEPGVGAETLLTVSSRGVDLGDVGVWFALRFIEFESDVPVLSGDRELGGAMFAWGGAIVVRF